MKFISRNLRYSVLTVSLLAFFFVFPFLEASSRGGLIFRLLYTWIILSALFSISQHRKVRLAGAALVLTAIFSRWWEPVEATSLVFKSGLLAETGLIILVVFLILGEVRQAARVTPDLVFGAVSVYLLLALLCSLAFFWLASQDPGAFRGLDEISFPKLLYFSLITITTTGYGDISPDSPAVRTLASLEALVGQLYLAVLIAGLVGIHVSQRDKDVK